MTHTELNYTKRLILMREKIREGYQVVHQPRTGRYAGRLVMEHEKDPNRIFVMPARAVSLTLDNIIGRI